MAAISRELVFPLASSLLVGFGAFALLRTLFVTLSSDDLQQDDAWRYDINRINQLRKLSPLYRSFQPVFDLLSRINVKFFPRQIPEISRQVQAAGLPRYWTGADWLARCQLIALLTAPLYIYICVEVMGGPGLILASVLTGMTAWLLRRRLASRAAWRLLVIKRRLPFLLDLLTLLMEAGSTFLHALEDAVEEFGDHPVGEEFGRVLAELSMGKSRTDALESMRVRLHDDEITSIVGSIIQGELLGTPLALLFRTQADVLRIKRTQRAETIAGEAGVKMLLPTILVMAATVIVILGPFLLSFIYADFMV